MRRAGGLLLVLACALGGACGGGTGRGGTSVPQVAPPATDAPRPVDSRIETFVDTSRPTEAHGSVAEQPSRTMRTTIFFPSSSRGAPFPLVVFAHGSGGLGTEYFPMLRAWAAAGYVVAAPALPVAASGPDGRPGDSSSIEDLPNQPGDLSFVISQLLAVNADPGSPLHGTIDPGRIGAAGHSLGAMATVALAGNTCCHDERVKAAVVLAGREAPFGTGVFFNRIRTPLLLVHGDADNTVAYSEGRKIYNDAPPPRFLLTLAKGGHSSMYDPFDDGPAQLAVHVTIDFLDTYLKDARDGPARLGADAGAAPGIARLESEV